MADKKNYSLGEAAALFGFGGVVVAVFLLVVLLPVGLFTAWIRETIWNWFAPNYLHLPRIGLWLMYAITLFIATFRGSTRSLKDDHYKESAGSNFMSTLIAEVIALALAWGVHHWILTGH